jgi:hypothetical protein
MQNSFKYETNTLQHSRSKLPTANSEKKNDKNNHINFYDLGNEMPKAKNKQIINNYYNKKKSHADQLSPRKVKPNTGTCYLMYFRAEHFINSDSVKAELSNTSLVTNFRLIQFRLIDPIRKRLLPTEMVHKKDAIRGRNRLYGYSAHH